MGRLGDLLAKSILADVRAGCSLEENDSSFDGQLIPLINSQLMVARKFGIGYEGFVLDSMRDTWQDLIGNDAYKLAAMRSWLAMSVKLMFDPPDNASVLKCYQDQIQKFEWMLCSESALTGTVKNYVTAEQAKVYDELYGYGSEESAGSSEETYEEPEYEEEEY